MAATLTPDGELTMFSFPIEKFDETEGINPVDGTPDIVVWGKATDGTIDGDLQIVDPEWSGKALQEWLETGGNLRVQHQARRDPAGKGISVEVTGHGHYVKSLVVEPTAKHLVRTGTLKDYSVGISHPDIRPSSKAMNGMITGRPDGATKISELSLVDRGSNFNSRFQLVKSLDDGRAEFVGKMLGAAEMLTKAAHAEPDDDEISVTLPKDVSLSFSPADLAKLVAHRKVAEKRQVDPDVGGGVDRDQIPAEDFAGKDRSYPIVTPKDVHDASLSIGRAGDDNYGADQLKANIIRIAKRKGAAFVAQLPDEWKDGDSDKAPEPDVAKKKGKGGAFPGAAKPFGKKDEPDDDGTDDAGKTATAEKAGAKSCTKCGKNYHSDTDQTNCENCGTKLPLVDKATDADIAKKDKALCKGCGANVDAKHAFCPECGKKMAGAPPIQKNHDYTCLGCGHDLDKGEGFCPGCGKKNPGFNETKKAIRAALKGDDMDDGDDASPDAKDDKPTAPDADSNAATPGVGDQNDDGDAKDGDKAAPVAVKKVKKAKKSATPTDAASEAPAAKPAAKHREPDGAVVATFEHDAGMPSDTAGDDAHNNPDYAAPKAAGDPEIGAILRLKTLGVPADLGALHDLTCPGFHPDDVAKAYPHASLNTLDTGYWQQQAFTLAASAPLEQAKAAQLLWQHAVTLKATGPEELLALRSEAHKTFTDANPGPGSYPTPSEMSATRFKRPYLTAGHAAPSPGQGAPNTAPVTGHDISASQYQRDYLSAGHAADSPANKNAPIPAPSMTGAPSRVYYANALRDNARQAMSAMHDHIAQTFPDICPMYGGSPYGDDTPPAPNPVPVGVGSPAPHSAPAAKVGKKRRRELESAVLAGSITLKDAQAELGIVTAEPDAPIPTVDKAVEPDVTKAAVLDAAAVHAIVTKAVGDAVAQRDAAHAAELADLRKTLKKQAKTIDVLASQPEPGGPFKGMAILDRIVTKAAPEARPTIPDYAARAQGAVIEELREQLLNPDPAQREVARGALMKMLHLDNTALK